jgi:hypothetical protein
MTRSVDGWHRRQTNTAAYHARRAKHTSREHRQARKNIQAQLNRGEHVRCWRCGRSIPNIAAAWHVGHSDDGTRIMGAEHASENVKAAARKGAIIANARRRGRRIPRVPQRAQSRIWR